VRVLLREAALVDARDGVQAVADRLDGVRGLPHGDGRGHAAFHEHHLHPAVAAANRAAPRDVVGGAVLHALAHRHHVHPGRHRHADDAALLEHAAGRRAHARHVHRGAAGAPADGGEAVALRRVERRVGGQGEEVLLRGRAHGLGCRRGEVVALAGGEAERCGQHQRESCFHTAFSGGKWLIAAP
jgi:hypothetical protein